MLALLAGLLAAVPARSVKLAKPAAEALVKEIAKDRADTEKWLRSDPSSYLATIDRRDFGDKKRLTVGRAADNDLRIDDPDIAPHHLRVTVDGDKFRVEAVDRQARYNPACAFSDHYNCPIPPKANVLNVAVRAGEMDSHYH